MSTKKIKVRIEGNVASYMSKGVMYLPGDIVEISEESFCHWFMTRIDELATAEAVKTEKAETEVESTVAKAKAEPEKKEALSLSPPPAVKVRRTKKA